jgi:hypothetical protein
MTATPSSRNLRFRAQVYRLFEALRRQEITDDDLVRTVRASGTCALTLRAAALRVLIGRAPLSVTQGRPYIERRAAVRAHLGV